jgi:RHS repeat-associated protein
MGLVPNDNVTNPIECTTCGGESTIMGTPPGSVTVASCVPCGSLLYGEATLNPVAPTAWITASAGCLTCPPALQGVITGLPVRNVGDCYVCEADAGYAGLVPTSYVEAGCLPCGPQLSAQIIAGNANPVYASGGCLPCPAGPGIMLAIPPQVQQVYSYQCNAVDLEKRLYFLQDEQRSVHAVANNTGVVREGYAYDPYGATFAYKPGANGVVEYGGDDVVAAVDESALSEWTYTGRRYDAESGLLYYRTRYLDSDMGRFISRDTIGVWGDPASLGNGFAYVSNRPTERLDPLGETGSTMDQLCFDSNAICNATTGRVQAGWFRPRQANFMLQCQVNRNGFLDLGLTCGGAGSVMWLGDCLVKTFETVVNEAVQAAIGVINSKFGSQIEIPDPFKVSETAYYHGAESGRFCAMGVWIGIVVKKSVQ